MQQIYNLINKRAEQHIPVDKPFKEAFPEYTDFLVVWYKVAEDLRDEFIAENLVESARYVADLIRENLSFSFHDKDRHIILANLKGRYFES